MNCIVCGERRASVVVCIKKDMMVCFCEDHFQHDTHYEQAACLVHA